METLNFLTPEIISQAVDQVGSPVYVYSRETIEKRCSEVSAFPNAFGLNARYALKANPHLAILKVIESMGLHFDASSEFEVMRCLHAGIPGEKIQLTGQQFPRKHLKEIVEAGVLFNACSLKQIDEFGKASLDLIFHFVSTQVQDQDQTERPMLVVHLPPLVSGILRLIK